MCTRTPFSPSRASTLANAGTGFELTDAIVSLLFPLHRPAFANGSLFDHRDAPREEPRSGSSKVMALCAGCDRRDDAEAERETKRSARRTLRGVVAEHAAASGLAYARSEEELDQSTPRTN